MKRGESGLSLLVGVNKPSGISSHDVVNRCRRIFGERRVGHTGTLDPLASGVLPITIGPACRLDRYLTGHDKTYRVTIAFGVETNTDDATGAPVHKAAFAQDLLVGEFAAGYIEGLVGERMQTPPQYSAIKIDGKKAYEVARKGKSLELEARPIIIHSATLLERHINETTQLIEWVVEFTVSKGTYIRALARDIGRELGSFAHVAELQRTQAGRIPLEICYPLDSLEEHKDSCALDPVAALGYRFAFGDELKHSIENGGRLEPDAVQLYESPKLTYEQCACCASRTIPSAAPLNHDELISIVIDNKLSSIYRFDSHRELLVPDCVFNTPVIRL